MDRAEGLRRRRPDRDFFRVGLAGALVLHGALALAFAFMPKEQPRPRRVVEVNIRKPPPPPPPVLTPPEPPKPAPEPERKIVRRAERPPEAPRPTRSQPPPSSEPPKPVFGLSSDDTVGEGMAVPQGNTTMADPSKREKGPVPALPPSSAPAGKEYRPVGESELKRLPDHDAEACGASMKEKYSTSQAYTEGVEGEVVFRVELDERGKIYSVKKVKGLGHGLDEMAMGFLRFNPRCRFGPAIGKDGKPAAYVIERYSVIFEAAR